MTTQVEKADAAEETAKEWHVVSRVVFPEADADTLPLYVNYGRTGLVGASDDEGGESPRKRDLNADPRVSGQSVVSAEERSHDVRDARALDIAAGTRASFATYFNAFPASYWRRWTVIDSVRLNVQVRGSANVIVYRTNARGVSQRVDSKQTTTGGEVQFDLPLKPFGDGGWYWFDIVAGSQPATLVEANWLVDVPPVRPGTLSIGVTTLNRPDYCIDVISAISESPELRERLDTLYIVDQGTKKVADENEYPALQAEMGDQLRIIDQANLGGSGGFSRGMYETVTAGRSSYHMMLDDDVVCDPESIVRALTFASYCRKPTLVGGHMFDMFNRTVLHAYGEEIDQWRWFWGPVRGLYHGHDLAAQGLRETGWIHQRIDVDYNGWWMCMVPVEVIKEIGLSLPVFIKWDDAEYGVRAKKAGYRTVSLPGAAVWHVSWTDKDDTVDWQAYYHERNRWLTGLLHSPYEQGGRLMYESVATDIKHIWSMQYYAQELRLMALRDILEGPEHLHRTIGTRLPELRTLAKQYTDATYEPDPEAFPLPEGKPKHKGRLPQRPSRRTIVPWLATTALHQVRPVKEEAKERPQTVLPHHRGKWWVLSKYDSAIVSKADGTGSAFYKRNPEIARRQMSESAALHAQLRKEWPRLVKEYREALPQFTSIDEWARTFGVDRDAR